MSSDNRGSWGSRSQFILAAIGSSVGLGNAWRFPGLAARHGGGAFLMAYLLAMLAIGVPFLMMEISVGRKTRRSAPLALRAANRRFEPIGWFATSNSFIISIYYSVVFAWVILMALVSFRFAGMTGDTEAASNLWSDMIQTTWTTSGYDKVSIPVIVCLLIAWALIYVCIRNGTSSVGKVVKYTVSLPVICLVILAVKGLMMPGADEALKKLFIPDFSSLATADLWIDAIGQVFFSMSIMVAIMFVYGSYLKEDSNIAKDASIIAFSDFAVSILSGVVLFTTMSGTGNLDNMSDSGIGTAFIIYPQSIVMLTGSGAANAVFAFVFYFCLCTLAIDSAFSLVETAAVALSDKFHLHHKKTTLRLCVVTGILSLWFTTGAGLAWLDIVDNWCNSYSLIIVGILEAVAFGWMFKPGKILKEINRNTGSFKMPARWFLISIKFLAPLSLAGFLVWNIAALVRAGGSYGSDKGYSLASNIIAGCAVLSLYVSSILIIRLVENRLKKKGFEPDEPAWDE